MPKLTPNQLKFIDNYLLHAGIKYADIRFEMTDHVASALEEMSGDFTDNLKEYMLQHKAGLLENNRAFTRMALGRAWKTLGQTLVKPAFLLLFALNALGFLYLKENVGFEQASDIMRTLYSVVVIVAALHNVYDRYVVKMKFSVSDKLLTTVCLAMYWVVYMMHMETHIKNQALLMVYFALVDTVVIAVYYTFTTLTKRYKSQFLK